MTTAYKFSFTYCLVSTACTLYTPQENQQCGTYWAHTACGDKGMTRREMSRATAAHDF